MTVRPNELSATEDFEFRALQEAVHYRAALVEEFGPYLKGRVLEVGCGIGQVTELLRRQPGVRTVLALEPEAGFCQQFRRRLVEAWVVQGTIDAVALEPGWDAIVSVNVLEHIEADDRELAAYHQRLAPRQGVLCLFVPARPEIYAPIDRDFGHFRRYTRPGLRGQLERAGFEVLRLDYFNCVGYVAWWFQFCVLRRRHFKVKSVRVFDRLIFPAMHRLESRLWRPPLGQSLMAAARAR